MARARTIKPAFFKNEELAELSSFARLLFIGLWTLCDREGRQRFRPKFIKAELFPYEDVKIHELIVELHEGKFLLVYETEGEKFIFIPGFVKHQRPHPNEPESELPSPEGIGTYETIVTKHDHSRQKMSNCALPSSNPLIPLPLPGRERKVTRDKDAEIAARLQERERQLDAPIKETP
jgi:hypothetical protein